ncbi:divergent polysaccharide deacetylase family protein [Catenovulum sediminis]|uniref:Divergent polysaccharide deacetylase family protein n=1 Tax=Catenovulum sediminis TaxID=1740262 RepID=A0ABV1RJ78_9ALTE|nr:divergent polysaccharide deacetylase family protein [Catenovulum sediminis]
MKRYIKKIIKTAVYLITLSGCSFSWNVFADIAIIIDDVGYRATDKALLTLPPEITLSVLPQTPYGKEIARLASARGHEIMLHLPMESVSGENLEPGTILSNMQAHTIVSMLNEALQQLPYAKGVNNHMGSKLTQMQQPMQIIMQTLKEKKLFFVDSRTSSQSRALQIAQQLGVTAYRRHVFLDNEIEQDAINRQLNKVLKMAIKRHTVIAIGHPHPETIAVLQKFFARYPANAIALQKVSQLSPANVQIAAIQSNSHLAD